ncbi:thioredoxin [Patescibacteria group bacterium]|nr:thioredoxin [Patescibacteria group bacterium]MBU1074970.1 thioredoxin [Patescibacteria group bacterium]MBU1951725.1 thioredoxin [Patescibacteria group bacterium]MBU2235563.1 thioredoxin [Patescibacteria group bacterium]
MAEIELNDQNFEKEVLKSDQPVLVDFWAEWCGPCKVMLPVMEELIKDNKDKPVKIAKMNIDENQVITQKFGVMSIPTFLFFKGGEVVNQSIGAQSKDDLQKVIDENL